MNKAGETIAAQIRFQGPITFARFMEMALYCPNYGYYEKEADTVGRRGDYYTSVSVGSLFGELLAFQFAEWLREGEAAKSVGDAPDRAEGMRIVEAGAHDGRLARDILSWLSDHRPPLFQQVDYWIVEPSEGRRNLQRRSLQEFGSKVRWVKELKDLRTEARLRGVVFSNELLDAMPVHRLGWDARSHSWFEWGVTIEAGRFVWTRLIEPQSVPVHSPSSMPTTSVAARPELWEQLPDGFTTEWCPAAEEWWRTAASMLDWGRLMTIDYGLTSEERFTPERGGGTLRTFRRHRSGSDVFDSPGEQDITAHIDFTAIRAAGESVGLRTHAFQTQAQFLTDIAARAWDAKTPFHEWTTKRTREFQTLTHPEHLGRHFRVLVQSRA